MSGSEASADVVLYYVVPCPHCGHMAPLEYHGVVEARLRKSGWVHEKGLTWRRGEPATACHVCASCGEAAVQRQLEPMLHAGRWQTVKGDFVLGADGFPVDDKPWPRHVAFFAWQAYGLRWSWEDIARDRETCELIPSNRQTFANETLGRYWERDAINLTEDQLMARAEEYEEVPKGVRLITFGMDVQKDRVEVEFVGWGEGQECWALEYHVEHGNTASAAFWDDDKLIRLLGGVDEHGVSRFGRMLPSMGVVDAGYKQAEVYGLCRRLRGYAYPCKGMSESWGAPIGPSRRPPLDKDHMVFRFNLGVTAGKDYAYESAMLPEGLPGHVHFRRGHGYDDDWYHQFLAEEREPHPKYLNRWTYRVKPGYARNEALDCRVLNIAAMNMRLAHGVELGVGPGIRQAT